MRLGLRQAELNLDPAVRLLPGHEAAVDQPVQFGVRLHAFSAQVPVRQGAHGQQGVPVGRHIGVTGGVPGAYIELGPRVVRMVAMDHGSWPQVRPGAAVGAFDVDPFHCFLFISSCSYNVVDRFGYDGSLAVQTAQAAPLLAGPGTVVDPPGNENGVPPVSPAALQKKIPYEIFLLTGTSLVIPSL